MNIWEGIINGGIIGLVLGVMILIVLKIISDVKVRRENKKYDPTKDPGRDNGKPRYGDVLIKQESPEVKIISKPKQIPQFTDPEYTRILEELKKDIEPVEKVEEKREEKPKRSFIKPRRGRPKKS